MTYEEAIERLEWKLNNCDGCGRNQQDIESFTLAIEALEKQIPKKPRIEYWENRIPSEQKVFVCPTCKEIEFGFNQPKFCENCGQLIDWSEEE